MRVITTLLCLFLLAACPNPPVNGDTAGGDPVRQLAWQCEDGFAFDAEIYPRHARLIFGGRSLILPQLSEAAVPRFAKEGNVFEIMGDEATLTLAGTDQRTCRVNRGLQAARERGVDYRAVGQEPGWVLDIISGDRFILEYAYGEKRLEAPWTKPDRLPAAKSHGGGLQYDAQSDSGRLTVVILDKPCQDAMSGRDYPDTVHVTLGDMRLSGCGRGL